MLEQEIYWERLHKRLAQLEVAGKSQWAIAEQLEREFPDEKPEDLMRYVINFSIDEPTRVRSYRRNFGDKK